MFESKEVKNMEGKFFGVYRAIISNVQDPKKQGRIKVYCPAVYGDGIESNWIIPSIQFIGNGFGMYCIPPSSIAGKRVYVWIMFEMGDPNFPIWFGSPIGDTNGITNLNKDFYKKRDGSDRQVPNNYGIITPGGHRIELDDDGSSNEIRIYHASNSAKITMSSGKIDIVGNVNIKGNVDISGAMHISGNTNSDADVVASGVSLVNHTHTGVHGETSSAH